MGALETFARVRHEARTRAAAAKTAGRKVVAYMGNTVPLELFDAAGLVAVPLAGDPNAPTPLADRYMESLFDPRVRAAMQSVLAGEWAMLDLIVLPRTSDSQQRFYYYLCELARAGMKVPRAKLYDLLHTPGQASANYNLARTVELKGELEQLVGAPIGADAMRTAIAAANLRREALNELVALRRQQPSRMGGVDALNAFAASRVLETAAFAAAVKDVAQGARAAEREGPRVIVAGSAQDRPNLHALIAQLGGTVVGDFHADGELMIGPLIETQGDPLEAICRHYHRHIASSRTFPSDIGAISTFARAARAQGVVFHYDAEEEALTWDLPAQRRDLETNGFKVVAFTDQPRAFDATALTPPLQQFLSALAATGGVRG